MAILIIRTNIFSIRLFILIILWIIFAYGYLSNYRYTWYYRYGKSELKLHLKMNEQMKLAHKYWDDLLKKPNYNHNPISDICTVLISSPRGKHPTLYYTLSSLVTSMTFEDKLRKNIFIYNTARPSYLHKYARQLSHAEIPYLKVINSCESESELYFKKNQFYTEHNKWLWTESIDYLSALSICDRTNSSYILILQDDLIFTKNFFTKLQLSLNNKHNCSWIRLFKSDFWDGWERKDVPIIIILSLCISTFIMFICLAIDNRKYQRSRWCKIETYEGIWNVSVCPILILFTFWLIWFSFILLILLSVNRQNFQFLVGPKSGVHPIESSVAGALAHLYPRWIKSTLEEYIHKRLKESLILNKPIPIDLLLIDFLEQNNTNFYQCHSIPDLVDHIGVYSSSIEKNQGKFKNMKQSGTFKSNEAAIDFNK